MGTSADRGFAALLDDLFAAPPRAAEVSAPPSIHMDYLSVAEELHSGQIKVSPDYATAEYQEMQAGHEGSFAAILAKLERLAERVVPEEKLPPIDPESIAAELGLGADKPRGDFGQLRRSFAFANHPDRVAPNLRQRAMVRMQIANMLIDDAKRHAMRATKR